MNNDRSQSAALEGFAQSALRIGYLWKKISSGAEHRFYETSPSVTMGHPGANFCFAFPSSSIVLEPF